MLRGSELIGLPIQFADQSSGERIINWILDIETNTLIGFLVTQGGWAGGARVLLWEDVHQLSAHTLTTQNRFPIFEISKVIRVKQVLEWQIRLIGLEVITRRGEDFGEVIDLCFDAHDGTLKGLISSGKLNGIPRKTPLLLPVTDPLNIVDGFIVATSEMTESMETIDKP